VRDVRDWNKYVDLLGKAVDKKPAAPLVPHGADAAAPPSPSPKDAAPPAALALPPLSRPAPPRQGRGRRKEETREQLLARLLDPTLTLEETACILGVCPTTVRRYTNKGILTHERSAGNQRRFKWSDVRAFLEAQARGDHAPPSDP